MISIRGRADLHKIVVMNPKGGSGKTTLTTNLASAFAMRGTPPTVVDCDPQGYCVRWIERRSSSLPEIYAIQGYEKDSDSTRSRAIDIPADSKNVIIDLPAAIPHERLYGYVYCADSLLLPIQASAIDIHAATRFIAELLLDAQLDRHERKLAIVACRIRSRTKSFEALKRFLTSLKIPMIAALRDSQNYVHAAAAGIGVCEMPAYRARQDAMQIEQIVGWLERRRVTPEPSTLEHSKIAMTARQSAESRDPAGSESIADPPRPARDL